MRAGRTALAGVLAAVLLGGAAAAVTGRGASAPAAPVVPHPSPLPSPAPLLPAPSDGPAPTSGRLAAALAAGERDRALGGRVAVSVLDVATGRPLLEQRATVPLPPASTAKLVTAVAALTALSPTARITTTVLPGARPGEVVLVGGGDPTLAGPADTTAYPRAARLTDLARQLGAARVTRVLVDDSAWPGPRLGPGWKPSYVTGGDVAPVTPLEVDGGRVRPGDPPRVADPALVAGQALARLLHVTAPVVRGAALPQALPLAHVQSPPVPALVERMLRDSDNDVAEALARQVARAQGLPPTFAGAATGVRQVLAQVLQDGGVVPPAPGDVELVDGSGLSPTDRVAPAVLSRLLALVASGRDPRLAPVLSGLPVAGFDGTLADRYRKGDARAGAGVVRAKTGTLLGVNTLAGLVRTADGRLLAFDLASDGVPVGRTRSGERALDDLATTLAACGCR